MGTASGRHPGRAGRIASSPCGGSSSTTKGPGELRVRTGTQRTTPAAPDGQQGPGDPTVTGPASQLSAPQLLAFVRHPVERDPHRHGQRPASTGSACSPTSSPARRWEWDGWVPAAPWPTPLTRCWWRRCSTARRPSSSWTSAPSPVSSCGDSDCMGGLLLRSTTDPRGYLGLIWWSSAQRRDDALRSSRFTDRRLRLRAPRPGSPSNGRGSPGRTGPDCGPAQAASTFLRLSRDRRSSTRVHAGAMSEPKLLKVVRGSSDETELAAVTAVLLAQLRACGHPQDPIPPPAARPGGVPNGVRGGNCVTAPRSPGPPGDPSRSPSDVGVRGAQTRDPMSPRWSGPGPGAAPTEHT